MTAFAEAHIEGSYGTPLLAAEKLYSAIVYTSCGLAIGLGLLIVVLLWIRRW